MDGHARRVSNRPKHLRVGGNVHLVAIGIAIVIGIAIGIGNSVLQSKLVTCVHNRSRLTTLTSITSSFFMLTSRRNSAPAAAMPAAALPQPAQPWPALPLSVLLMLLTLVLLL